MLYLSKDALIKELNLSNRSYNALVNNKIINVKDLINLSDEELLLIKNIGKRSYTEIKDIISKIVIIDCEISKSDSIENAKKVFIYSDGNIYYDEKIENFGLSNRAYNCLKRRNINYYSQIYSYTKEELYKIKNMGYKSVNEVLNLLSSYRPTLVEQSIETYSVKDSIRYRILKDLSSKLYIKVNTIDKKMLFLLDNYSDNKLNEDELYNYICEKLYDITEVIDSLTATIIKKIDLFSEIEEIKLFEELPSCLQNNKLFNDFISHLMNENLIIKTEEGYIKKRYISINDYICNISDKRSYEILAERMQGKTLDEIGKKFNLTKERVRQIECKYMERRPRVIEDKYSYIFQRYYISREDFIDAFDEKKETYNYLMIAYSRGEKNIFNAFDDSNLSNNEIKCLYRIKNKNYVILNGEKIMCSRAKLSEYILSVVGKDGISFDEFKDLYLMLIRDLNLQDDNRFLVMDRGYENKLSSSDHVLWKQHRKMRYYNINAYDYTNLFLTLELEQYNNIEISTLKLFKEHLSLMDEYDIHDEYELHNLLKKICRHRFNINFKRMPNIEFGNSNRDEQVLFLLKELSPISNTDLAKAYEEKYGVLSKTVLSNYFKCIEKYNSDGMYKINIIEIPQHIIENLIEELNKDFYFISEIKDIIEKKSIVFDFSMVNSYIMNKLGYRKYSNYIISDKYSSASDYFRHMLTEKELFYEYDFANGITNLQTYNAELSNLKSQYIIIEYEPKKYINIKKLFNINCKMDEIKDYCSKIYTYENYRFFTIYSLYRNGFEHSLDRLGFDEWFYSSLLVEDSVHFSYKKIGGNRLFKKGTDEISVIEFIEWILYCQESLSIDIYELSKKLLEEYNVNIGAYKIIEMVKGSLLYYDRITEKLYAEYEVYFDEI